MSKQKEANGISIVYLILLLGNILICAGGIGLKRMGVSVSSALLTFLCELFILIPVIIYIRSKNESLTESLGFHKIKFSTILLTVLLTIAVTPIYYFANVLSQIFVSNIMIQQSESMMEDSILVTIIMTSIIAPLFEEIAFRGFFFNRIKTRSSVLKAAIISAVLFGLMHLNLNQFSYAVVLGFVFALANQASGSTWTSVIMHVIINFVNMGFLIMATLILQEYNMDLAQAQEASGITQGSMLPTLGFLGVFAIIGVFFVWILLKAIAKNEGNLDSFKEALSGKEAHESEFFGRVHSIRNAPMMTSLFIGIAAMIIIYSIYGFTYTVNIR